MAKGLAMYDSLIKQSPGSILYVMAFDDDCFKVLTTLGLPNMVVENVSVIETEKILSLKKERTRAEYCWTLGPTVINYFIEAYSLPEIIYLDSDLYFIGKPEIALEEIGNNSVAITEQGISKRSAYLYGRYCVQYMYFKNDSDGMLALRWWMQSCIDWCYQRFEDGKYGDQKYLDQFPIMFNNVYVVKNIGVGIAPWNMYRYKYDKTNNLLYFKNKTFPAVFFHMHGLRFEINENQLNVTTEEYLSKKMIDNYFNSYLSAVISVYNKYLNQDIESFNIQCASWLSRVFFLLKEPIRSNSMVRRLYSLFTGNK